MASSTLIAYASPKDSTAEQAWLQWYTDVHIPEVRASIPEITEVVRYRLLRAPDATPRFCTRYEASGLDVAELAARLGAAAPGWTQSDLMADGDDAPAVEFASSAA